jgi:hypothetical protein
MNVPAIEAEKKKKKYYPAARCKRMLREAFRVCW